MTLARIPRSNAGLETGEHAVSISTYGSGKAIVVRPTVEIFSASLEF